MLRPPIRKVSRLSLAFFPIWDECLISWRRLPKTRIIQSLSLREDPKQNSFEVSCERIFRKVSGKFGWSHLSARPLFSMDIPALNSLRLDFLRTGVMHSG